ncbi:ubiquitin-like domain-containing protein [Candidatus Latescibacterota bacterium]
MKLVWQKSLYILIFTVCIIIPVQKTFAIELTVITSTGVTIKVQAEPDDEILEVKEFVFNVTRIHPGNQVMFKDDVRLDYDKTLAFYNIADGDTIQVKLGTGGAPTGNKYKGIIKTFVYIVIFVAIIYIMKKWVFVRPDLEEYEE